ncbi:MAG: glycosyltransferase family 4 protein [Bacteroidales bacterium]|nr:glycosyltransferase family 4 protein [Bacteroidales bacterium]MBO5075546.1 glycosyltransferase family 4 protein [Bacteroidales bacterium]
MKRVLIISYYWPPTGGSGVQRWVKFAKYLPEEGWQPVIYTPENPEQLAKDTSLEAEVPEETEVIKTHIIEPYELYKKVLRKSGHSKEAVEVNPVNAQHKSFLQKTAMWVRGNLFRPDPRCLWIRPSVRFLKKYLAEHPVDLIVSTGPPQSMHLIGLRLARETGLPWIADFRDPWTRIFYFKHLQMTKATERWHEKMEKKVLDEASAVVAVSPLVQQEFQAMTDTPVELITNGFDECDFEGSECTEAYGGPEKNFTITHTGLFAADGNPTVLWDVLSEKCAKDEQFRKLLKIKLIGKNDEQISKALEDRGLKDMLEDMGYQPHSAAVQEQRTASVLILPLRKEPEYKAVLPGKLFEYLASFRPVLGIGQTDGAMAMILNETKTGKVIDWEDKEGISEYIEKCWERHLEGRLTTEGADLSHFTRRSITRRMVQLFERLASHP